MNVLVIPEDFRKDAYVLEPLVRAMLAHVGFPRARVNVCRQPLLGGVGEALKWERIHDVIDRYPMVDLFLLVVDRDGEPHRTASIEGLERKAAEVVQHGRRFLGENAWQEIEVWVLAGHDLPADWKWAEIRAERDAKERYFEPFARRRGVADGPGGGRRVLAEEAARRYPRVRQLCSEDLGRLEARLRVPAGAGPARGVRTA